ncbi:hypothetical protein F4778DRAFT_740336 [Xylariomycetidae sp. FL2044]|nr:hypothetical protein F4778DRAFT_740336 [Xylariomycetidae sp. FL2044]
MESFQKLKRRGTDLLNSLPQNMPSMPHMPQVQMPSMPRLGAGAGAGAGPAMKGTWQHVQLPALPRSSHSLDIVAGNAYIFGGEAEPGKPVDNDMHIVVLPSNSASADYYAVKAKPTSKVQLAEDKPATITEEDETTAELQDPLTEVPLEPAAAEPPTIPEPPPSTTTEKGKAVDIALPEVPSARFGHASAVIGTRIFVFGGRTATSEAIEEKGRVWVFETKTHTWSYLDPYHDSPIPPARSDFAAVAIDKPRDFSIKPLRRTSSWKEWAEGDSAAVGIPQRPIAGSVAERATDEEEAGFGTLIIHGGCLADGSRAADVWAFDVRSCTWKQLPAAPKPARAGACLAVAKSRLYRFGGSDDNGRGEALGGQLDVLDLGLDEFDDRVSRGEIGVFARGDWHSLYPPVTNEPREGETAKLVETEPWPAPRTAAAMQLVLGGGGREYLVLMLGEASSSSPSSPPSSSTTYHSDVWAFQLPPLGMTAASLTDAMLQAVGRRTGEGRWTPVAAAPYDDEADADVRGPGPRGRVAAAPLGDIEESGVLVLGGVGEKGARLGDAWIFRLG